MATSKNHILMSLLSGHTLSDSVILTTPDSIRCWTGPRQFTHYAFNPETGKISGIEYPTTPVSEWSRAVIALCKKYDAGKPGIAAVDEATILEEFWRWNKESHQNELFYEHLVQDKFYDNYVRKYVDVSRKYEDVYVFDGKTYSGEQFRKSGKDKWNGESLVNSIDSQLFVELAKHLYYRYGIIANRAWFEKEVFPVFKQLYCEELYINTIKYITMTDFCDETISSCKFDTSGPFDESKLEWFVDSILYWLKK